MPVFTYVAPVGQRFVVPAVGVWFTGNRASPSVIARFRVLGSYEDGSATVADPANGYYSFRLPAGGHEIPMICLAASVRQFARPTPRQFLIDNTAVALQLPITLPQAVDSAADVETAVPTASGQHNWAIETDPAVTQWGIKIQPLTIGHPLFLWLRSEIGACCTGAATRLAPPGARHRQFRQLIALPNVAPGMGFGVTASIDGEFYDFQP